VLADLESNQISIEEPTRKCLLMRKIIFKRAQSEFTYFQGALLDNIIVKYQASKKAEAIKFEVVCFMF
jgi:hypothetical protein